MLTYENHLHHFFQLQRISLCSLKNKKVIQGLTKETRTTRTPVFWDTPAAPWLPILVINIRSQVKTTQSQNYKFKKIAKIANFKILQETWHATHLLKLLYKMYKYEMDLIRTVEATERTRDAGRTRDRRTDGRTDGRSETNIPPQQLRCAGV